jgi:hypothetical protein
MSSMDDNRTVYGMKALGASRAGSALRLPGREPFPRVDDHLVRPEVTRDEILGGRRVVASPAKQPHASQHGRLDYLLQAHMAPGYDEACDLLTRHDRDSDFASDACVFKQGIDPETGTRHLEEIAFEVVAEQDERDVREKAQRMHQRGVRRIFAVWVKGQRVCEWTSERQAWRQLAAGTAIADPCLVRPLAVSALLDAAEADNAVAEALYAKGNPVIRKLQDEGRAEGVAESILKILADRSVAVSPAERQEILRCRDRERLDRWLLRATRASSVTEILVPA